VPRSPAAATRPVTEHDVARAAGVSPSTVSRIVNGSAGVSAEKRRAVEAAIEKLKYRPNQSARSLKMGRTMTIGVLVQDIESPFFTRLLRGVEQGLQGSGYVPIIVSGHWNAKHEEERIRLLSARGIDGLVVLAGFVPEARLREHARVHPIAVVGRELAGTRHPLPCFAFRP